MKLDIALIILKYVGSIVGIAYGLYATLTDFHEQKHGKKVLSKKGKYGILILILSSLLTLITSALGDYKDNTEKANQQRLKDSLARADNIRQDSARAQEARMIEKLDAQLKLSNKVSEKTSKISKELYSTTKSIDKTALLSQKVFEEETEQINYVDVRVLFLFDRKNFAEYFQQKLPPNLYEFCLKSKGDKSLLPELCVWIETHKQDVKDFIFEIPRLGYCTFYKNEHNVAAGLVKEELEFISSSLQDTITHYNKDWGLPCLGTFRISSVKTKLFRKYTDFEGVEWGVFFNGNQALSIGYIQLDFGELSPERRITIFNEKAYYSLKNSVNSRDVVGILKQYDAGTVGKAKIPKNYFGKIKVNK